LKKLRHCVSFLIATTAVLLSILLLLPLQYAGASPPERFLRLNDGGNVAQSVLDSVAIALSCKSGIFDIRKDEADGVFIYRIEAEKDMIETYWNLGEGNNQTASYIIIKNGVRYQFSMDEDGWRFESSRVCLTDLKRLAKNMALVLTDKNADTAALATDLSGIVGIDLSKYLNFQALPTVIRSMMKTFEDESFRQAVGYSFKREDFTLQYHFSPADSKILTDEIHAVAKPAYTKKLQSIVNVAGIAEGFAGIFGFDLYGRLFYGDLSLSLGAFSGKLIKFTYMNDNTTLTVTNRKYGGCRIKIDSAQLEALMAKHIT